jgi:hypothetical protein
MNNMIAVTMNERPASLVDWSMVSEWITIDLAAFLIGVDAATIDEIIDLAGVDAMERDGETLIDRESLREFWDIYHAIANDRISDDT